MLSAAGLRGASPQLGGSTYSSDDSALAGPNLTIRSLSETKILITQTRPVTQQDGHPVGNKLQSRHRADSGRSKESPCIDESGYREQSLNDDSDIASVESDDSRELKSQLVALRQEIRELKERAERKRRKKACRHKRRRGKPCQLVIRSLDPIYG